MNREIEFRGKSIDTGKWIYGDYNDSIEEGDNGGTEVNYQGTSTRLTYINNELVYPETVGQYIGSKDKNGKKIYENDILSIKGEVNSEVIFSNNCFVGHEINGWDKMTEYFTLDNTNSMFIMGNRFDNPELLKSK